MRIIKLNAIDSTNSYLRKLSVKEELCDLTIVTTKFQKNGRGQMGTTWNSETGKNLIASIYKRYGFLELEEKFLISMVVSISVIQALKRLLIRNLNIKWPNDILAESKKIGGILIENVIKNNKMEGSIIGIGLNINQTQFEDLPRASSLLCLSGKNFEVDEILYSIIENLVINSDRLEAGDHDYIYKKYHQYLFRRDKPSTFRDDSGKLFSGFIKGVNESGTIKVLLEDQLVKEFDLKEITLLY